MGGAQPNDRHLHLARREGRLGIAQAERPFEILRPVDPPGRRSVTNQDHGQGDGHRRHHRGYEHAEPIHVPLLPSSNALPRQCLLPPPIREDGCMDCAETKRL